MNLGCFDDERREYVITDPRTPVKWINYIGTLAFGGFVDQTGGALLCRGDPASNRILKYIPQLPDSDFKGSTLYLRIQQDDGFQILSPFFVPGLEPLDRFECRVGLGYSRWMTETHGLRTEVAIFVPLGAEVELRDIRITNLSAAPLTVDAIPVVEYSHPDALRQLTNADWVPQTMQSRALRQAEGRLVLMQCAFMYRDDRPNYLTSNAPVSSFESDRRAFLGRHGYGTWAQPGGLHQPELGDSEVERGDNIGALLHPLGTLQPGQKRRLVVQSGQASGLEAALASIDVYRQESKVDQAFEQLRLFWAEYLDRFQVRTPEPSVDSMVNIHNPRQSYVAKHWSRDLSLYQLGFGARGHGFRDSAQDSLGVLHAAPQEARDLLSQLLQVQKADGSAMHQFYPGDLRADAGYAQEIPDAPQYYSDDHLWIVLAVAAYLRETGDLAYLEQEMSFYSRDRRGEIGSVLDHLRRALAFTRQDVGAHGLPLLGFADWNDTVNLARGAESVFSACLYGRALLEMADVLRHIGRGAEADRLKADHEVIRRRVNDVAWDGDWYVAYFDVAGEATGSRRNRYGQIYLHVQPWAVISGVADAERARRTMDSVHERLNTSYGIKLTGPAYNGYDPRVGGITTYPPGAKENGGIFLHCNPWAMIAECLLGNGRRAYQYFRQINPALRNDEIEVYECEPYVYAQNILGDEHPQFGLARNSWLTGTAAWAYLAATQYLLGIQTTHHGLRLAPCLPDDWPGFHAWRVYRGARYEIEVENPRRAPHGVSRLELDGRRVEGDVLPVPEAGSEHVVRVVM